MVLLILTWNKIWRFSFQVSWIRKRDLHILTAGILTYTSDQRFQVIRPDKSDNWTLQIKFPQIRDSGIYECQVNTEPKMSLPFRLNVIGKQMIPYIFLFLSYKKNTRLMKVWEWLKTKLKIFKIILWYIQGVLKNGGPVARIGRKL